MRLTEVLTSAHRIRYVVLDDQGELVVPLAKYLKHLDQRGYALNTLRSYGTSLMLFFEYLHQRDADFRAITLDTLAGFVAWLMLTSMPCSLNSA
jgi:integrase/recombinase XerD